MIFRDFEQNIVKVINESGMSIDAVYFIMKSLMSEIEQKYTEFCRQEDAERMQAQAEASKKSEEAINEDDSSITANQNKE